MMCRPLPNEDKRGSQCHSETPCVAVQVMHPAAHQAHAAPARHSGRLSGGACQGQHTCLPSPQPADGRLMRNTLDKHGGRNLVRWSKGSDREDVARCSTRIWAKPREQDGATSWLDRFGTVEHDHQPGAHPFADPRHLEVGRMPPLCVTARLCHPKYRYAAPGPTRSRRASRLENDLYPCQSRFALPSPCATITRRHPFQTQHLVRIRCAWLFSGASGGICAADVCPARGGALQ